MKSTRSLMGLFVLFALGMNPVAALRADDPPVHASAKIARPEKLTATIGDVLIRIDGLKLWTLSGIDFQNSKIAVQDSAYGSACGQKTRPWPKSLSRFALEVLAR